MLDKNFERLLDVIRFEELDLMSFSFSSEKVDTVVMEVYKVFFSYKEKNAIGVLNILGEFKNHELTVWAKCQKVDITIRVKRNS